MLVDGEPGLGKTHCLHRASVQYDWVYIRAKAGWSQSWMMREIVEALNVVPAFGYPKMFRQAVTELADRISRAERDDTIFALVIDEIDHIARNEKALETLRDLSDLHEFPVILGGMDRVRKSLKRYPQIASRIGEWCQFERLAVEDVRQLADGLCEVPVADCMVEYLHRVSGGLPRELKEALARVERFGRRNPPGETGVTVEAMAGQHLMNDRKNNQPIVVRG
jgi:DNA transposition AAA+ family ATPase